ncbi:RPS15 [Symbiodinium natans]|uniref:RPS15 protein n=1 Tax=Symbiodinium natans TaxID=878477 RepID=A0A812R995_9DINO|nr:RPS15 [Symbiodinium natans]
MKRAKRDGKKEEKEKKASSPTVVLVGHLLGCACVSLCGLAVGSSPSFYSEAEGKASIFVRLPFFFVSQALFNEVCLGLGLQLARWIRGDPGNLPWHATKEEAIQHDAKIPWPACKIPEVFNSYRAKPGQPFFLNHVTGRQRCKDACMRLGMGVGALLGVWFMCKCMDRRDLSSLGFTLDRPFFGDAAAGLVVGVTIVSFMFIVELLAGWVIFLQWFEVFDKSENFAVCIFWDVLFHLNVAVNEELPVRGWLLYNLAEASMAHWQLPATAAFLFAMVLESVFFVLMHLPSPGGTRPLSMINIFVGGMAGGLNVLLTGGRLGFALGWHFGWNISMGNVFGRSTSGIPISATFISVLPHPEKETYHGACLNLREVSTANRRAPRTHRAGFGGFLGLSSWVLC